VVEGKENIPRKGPLIIAANHPNTFMDPLLIAAFVKQRVGFLANAGIFRNKYLAAFLSYMHVIPIFRKQDLRPGEVQDNTKYFSKSVEYLEKKGTFMIFPEGSSFYEFKLREIKTGTARIAFQFEGKTQFKEGLKIQTVALNYSDAIKFRSKVMITFNKPIDVSDFKDEYLKDEESGIRSLTHRIEEELAEQLVIADTPEKEELLRRIQKVYADYWIGNKRLREKNKTEMEIRIALAKAISYFHDHLPEEYKSLEQKIDAYYTKAETVRVSQNLISNSYLNGQPRVLQLLYLCALILGLPIFLLGYFTHFVPISLSILISKIPEDIEYRAPLLMGSATFIIPIFYFLEIWGVHYYFNQVWITLLFALSLPLSGGFVWIYRTAFIRFKKLSSYLSLQMISPKFVDQLKQERREVLLLLEKARKTYSQHRKQTLNE
jgi:1-acyl-sn-glycerol-3-phosphate acyltransferase